MSNRYPGHCAACGRPVEANAGELVKRGRHWQPVHLDCQGPASQGVSPQALVVTLSSGVTLYRNARGRCEDAPCCGCCTF